MQRRHAIIAAIALVALVLIPAAALASGFGDGFGHRGTPLGPKNGPKNVSCDATGCAGTATAPNWTGGNRSAARDCAGTGGCIGDRAFDRDRAQQRDGDCLGNTTGNQGRNGTQARDGTCALNRTGSHEKGRPLDLQQNQNRAHRGQGR